MAFILKNKNLEIHIDPPLENYNFSRFDWTGKIVKVKFQNIDFAGIEKNDCEEIHHYGKGFYNEFGIDTPIDFDEVKSGDRFHKIGVGLLKKEGNRYDFMKAYEIKPATFEVFSKSNKLIITCKSDTKNGYSCLLKKEIKLLENGFVISYNLQNTGHKTIVTTEYIHNFITINNDFIGPNYILKLPFQLKPNQFGKTVNPDQKVFLQQKEIGFNSAPKEPFFFSFLSGGENVNAKWELINLKNKIGISETGNFQTNKVNLWGTKHVISPELFFNINLNPNNTVEWSRTYNIFKIG